jgi:hypothetical protein
MNPIRRILVPIKDPSTGTLPAVAKAARIAKCCGAELELFHAMKGIVDTQTPADRRWNSQITVASQDLARNRLMQRALTHRVDGDRYISAHSRISHALEVASRIPDSPAPGFLLVRGIGRMC